MGYTRSHSTRENIAGQIMKALLLLLVISRSSHGRPQIGSTEPEQQSIVSLQSGQQQFMNRLLQQIESNTTTNFVLSPHSIHSVFSQLLQGSGGRTKEELESLLGVRASDSLVEQYRILGQGLAGEGFKQANLLAVANSFKPKIEFRTNLNSGFQSDIREFDFGSNSLGSVQEINKYVEDQSEDQRPLGQRRRRRSDKDGPHQRCLLQGHLAVRIQRRRDFRGRLQLTRGQRQCSVHEQGGRSEDAGRPGEPDGELGAALRGPQQIYADRPSQCRHLHTGLGPKTRRTRPCRYQNQWEVSQDLHFHPQVQVEVQDLPEAADGGAWREGPLRPVCQPDWHQRRGPLGLRSGAPGLHRGERGGDRGCGSHHGCCGLENCSAEEEGVLRRSAVPLRRLRLRAWRHLVRRQGGQPQQRQRDPDESCSDPRVWNCASQSIRGGLCGLQQDVPGLPQFPGQLKYLQ